MSCMIFGTTGLCGKEIIKCAEQLSLLSNIISVTRRPFDSKNVKVQQVIEKDVHRWKNIVLEKRPNVVFSALATTRAAAGSAEAFVDVDYHLNLEIAKAAKDAGTHTFVLVSAIGADANSLLLYFKTKGRLEDAILNLKFPRTIILRPGPLLGERDKSKGFMNDLSTIFFKPLHGNCIGRTIFHPVYGHEVGKVAVQLAVTPLVHVDDPVVKIVLALDLLRIANSIKLLN